MFAPTVAAAGSNVVAALLFTVYVPPAGKPWVKAKAAAVLHTSLNGSSVTAGLALTVTAEAAEVATQLPEPIDTV